MTLLLPIPANYYDVADERERNRLLEEADGENVKRNRSTAFPDDVFIGAEIRDNGGAVFNVKHPEFGALGNGVADDTDAISAAITKASLHGGIVFIPRGNYVVSETLVVSTSSVEIHGAGIDATELHPSSSFTGTEVFEVGNKSSTVIRTHLGIKDLTIDLDDNTTLTAVGMYGCRDGSFLTRVYVRNHTSTAFNFNMAGNGTGSAALKMNQGCVFDQLVAVGDATSPVSGDVFSIDGTYESVFRQCKAFGFSSVNDGKVQAFAVGMTADVRGVYLEGATAGQYDYTADSCAVRYGPWARNCWDVFTSAENIYGNAIRFDGSTTSGSLLPFNCRSIAPRVFNISTANILDPAIYFGSANACFAEINFYRSTKTWVEFAGTGGANDFNNRAIINTNTPAEDITADSIVVFGGSTSSTNAVEGLAVGDTGGEDDVPVRFLLTSDGLQKLSRFPDSKLNGTATLANGNTSVAVTHGLGVTPDIQDISVTPIEAWGSMTQFWIDTPTSTQFTINADQDPGQDVDFAWTASVQ